MLRNYKDFTTKMGTQDKYNINIEELIKDAISKHIKNMKITKI